MERARVTKVGFQAWKKLWKAEKAEKAEKGAEASDDSSMSFSEWFEGPAFANDDERDEYLAVCEELQLLYKSKDPYEFWRRTRTDPTTRKKYEEWKVKEQAEKAEEEERRESRRMAKADARSRATEEAVAAVVEEHTPELATIAAEEAKAAPKVSELLHVIGAKKGGTYGKSKK